MKIIATILTLISMSSLSWADSVSNDFSRHSSDQEASFFSPKQLREQLTLTGRIYVTSPDGEILYRQGAESRIWKFSSTGDLISHWAYTADHIPEFFLKSKWEIDQKGRLSVHIQQFDSMTPDPRGKAPKLGKLLKEERKVIKNLQPIVWETQRTKELRTVIHIIPSLAAKEQRTQDLGQLPISAKGLMAADNKGQLWIQNASFSGSFVSLKTYNGTVHLSYHPFKGSEEIGFVKNNRMRVTVKGKRKLTLLNSSPFVPAGVRGKVYGRVDLKKISDSPNSLFIQTSSKEKEFLDTL